MRFAKHAAKFRRDPKAYLADSRYRALSHLALPILTPLLDRPAVRAWLFDPETAALELERPASVRLVVSSLVERSRVRRRARAAAAGHPLVSVIMPVYNAAVTIDEAARSVLDQTYSNIELVLVDDGSRDESLVKMRQLESMDSRIRVVEGPVNHGAGVARNRGLATCAAPFIAFQDADDVSHPERIERQVDVLLKHPWLVACYCYGRRVDALGRGVPVNGRLDRKWPPTLLLRRDPVLTRVGYFRAMRIAEDTEYMKRIDRAFTRARIATVNKVMYFALYSPRSTQFSDGQTVFESGQVHHVASQEVVVALANMDKEHAAMAASQSFYVPFEHSTELR